MNLTERIKTWHVVCSAILVTIAMLGGGWKFLNTHFIPRAEAAQAHEELIRRELREVRERLREQRLYRAKVKAAIGIDDEDRIELLATIEEDITALVREEKCLEAGNLRCD